MLEHIEMGLSKSGTMIMPGGEKVNKVSGKVESFQVNGNENMLVDVGQSIFLGGILLVAVPLILAALYTRFLPFYFAFMPVLGRTLREFGIGYYGEERTNGELFLTYVLQIACAVGFAGVIGGLVANGFGYWAGLVAGVVMYLIGAVLYHFLPQFASEMRKSIEGWTGGKGAEIIKLLVGVLWIVAAIGFATFAVDGMAAGLGSVIIQSDLPDSVLEPAPVAMSGGGKLFKSRGVKQLLSRI